MEKSNMQYAATDQVATAQQTFISKVYAWMVGGLLVTALTALYAFESNLYISIGGSALFYVLIIGEFGLVIALSGWIERMSKNAAILSFMLYSLLNGLTFSVILALYTAESIYNTFFIAAGMFAALSFFGYVTKKDLSGVGRFMFMGLIGIILATIVNMFVGSFGLNFVISIIGVIVFAGLTAYDTQKIKEMYILMEQGDTIATKGAIMGALKLYLDFINLFLFLLRFLGNRD